MSKKVSITLDDEILNFVDRLASNRSSFINDILWKEKQRIFMKERLCCMNKKEDKRYRRFRIDN
jgi:metal-responsive CopG/Arc/MetJ family transcriptional regulator